MLVIHPDECSIVGVLASPSVLPMRSVLTRKPDMEKWGGVQPQYSELWPVIITKKIRWPLPRRWTGSPAKLDLFSEAPGEGG